jgi:hypothetical protein
MVAEIAANADDPAVLGLKQNGAVAPVRGAAGDHDRELAVEVGGAAAIDPGGVSDPDFDFLLLRALKTEALEPCRARRTAAAGIDTRSAARFVPLRC